MRFFSVWFFYVNSFAFQTDICYNADMYIWTNIKNFHQRLIYRSRKKRFGLRFPLYCKIHGVKNADHQGAITQSRAEDALQIVHSPTKDYPYNIFVYSVNLNRILGYLHPDLSKKLVRLFGKGFCRDAFIENVTGGRQSNYKYLGCNIRIVESMRNMQNINDFSHLYDKN